ncbi:MAG: T9SS type A sorting domain-containing protein [Bacteroidales bacterium]|nr:T9SS type A sorting domain-containing protein [Bacteroidales bacterium]
MKNFLLSMLFPLLMLNTFGQSVNQENQPKSKEVDDPDQLTVSFTSTDPYVSGTTMDLHFTITFSSSLGDQADLFRLTFPAGMTPTGGTPILSYVNPINITGQIVSWGSDHNNTGQFSIMAGTYNIFVTVQIDASLSGDQGVAYLLSPRYAGYPDVTGTALVAQDAPSLQAPTNLLANVVDGNNVDLTWEMDGKAGFLNFNIYRNDALIATTSETMYSDTDLLNGDFEYFVTALYDEGESEQSNVEMVTIEKDPWVIIPTGTVHTIQVPASVAPGVFGVPLAAGDWIGVFYVNDEGMEICGGAATISPFGNTVVSAYGDDITTTEKDGFADGDAFWWRLFDMSETAGYDAVAAYDASAPNQGFFVNLGLSKLTALDAVEFISNFVFNEGWNSMSCFITPENAAVEELFAPITDQLILFRNLTDIYWPEENYNTIGDFNNQSGYVLKLTEAKSLQVIGNGMANQELVLANAGWYYMPVLSECPVSIEQLFGDQISEVVIIQELIGTGVYWPEMEIYSLTDLLPGKAYSIKVSDAVTLQFPDCELKSGGFYETNNSIRTRWGILNFSPVKQITALLTSAMTDLEPGDMIGAFDLNDNQYGFTTLGNLNENAAINLFGSDALTSVDNGFLGGDQVKFKVFRPSTGEEFELIPSYSEQLGNVSGKFYSNSFAAINSATLKTGIDAREDFGFELFPNPAGNNVFVTLNSPDSQTAYLKILDMNGRLVMQQNFQNQIALDVSGLNAGVYFVEVVANQSVKINKLVIK